MVIYPYHISKIILPLLPISLKMKVPQMCRRPYMSFPSCPPLPLWPGLLLSLANFLGSPWPPHKSWNNLGTLPPHGLCPSCFLSGKPFPQGSTWPAPHPPQVFTVRFPFQGSLPWPLQIKFHPPLPNAHILWPLLGCECFTYHYLTIYLAKRVGFRVCSCHRYPLNA